jgi:uncharacterized coiled-coil DUF342 family protein
MQIERVQIEEGFLDGLDVEFVAGLNVIIGERGTGKTSLIELMRYCLDVPGYTPESGKRSREHALSVLGAGQVAVTLRQGAQIIRLTRAAGDSPPRVSRSFTLPIIFSQSEIESVGLQPSGRLQLIDSFARHSEDANLDEATAVSETRSFIAEADSLRRELEELERQAEELPLVEQQIKELLPSEERLRALSAEAAKKKQQIDQLSSEISRISVAASANDRFLQAINRWQAAVVSTARSAPEMEAWPSSAGNDPLSQARERIQSARSQLQNALGEISKAADEAKTIASAVAANRIPLEEKARSLRKEVDGLQAGAGEIVRQASQLRERKAQLESLQAVIRQRKQKLDSVVKRRDVALDRLEIARAKKFKMREAIAANINAALGPRIRVRITRGGQQDLYAAAIADLLRGSGLRYGELAPTLAKSVSPRELLEAAQSNNYEFIAEAAQVSRDRAARALAQIREGALGELATVAVEDDVSLHLLDGQDYKEIDRLSTGQRCTVILPLVLCHTDRILIVDQPEDHIDNAFIADTLIRSILARDKSSQIIFSTHNANIPVLGSADNVLHLGSDGHRGHKVAQAPLEDDEIVSSISTVMEGGAEAFERRASFYRRHELS